MTKNKLIAIIGLIILLVAIIAIVKKNVKSKDEITTQNKSSTVSENILFDEETGLYYVKNPKTNEIISASHDESTLEFFKDNPDYNPNPLKSYSTDIKDFMYQDEIEEQIAD